MPEKLEALQVLAESQFSYVNLYVVGLVKEHGAVVSTLEQLQEEIRKYI